MSFLLPNQQLQNTERCVFIAALNCSRFTYCHSIVCSYYSASSILLLELIALFDHGGMLVVSLPFSRTTQVSWYQNFSILDFIIAKDDGCDGDS